MGGEQVYLFDINESSNSKTFLSSSRKYSSNYHKTRHFYVCTRGKIIIFTLNYVLLDSIERDEDLGKYMKQNNISYTENFVEKTVKILPPYVEELKRQVSL